MPWYIANTPQDKARLYIVTFVASAWISVATYVALRGLSRIPRFSRLGEKIPGTITQWSAATGTATLTTILGTAIFLRRRHARRQWHHLQHNRQNNPNDELRTLTRRVESLQAQLAGAQGRVEVRAQRIVELRQQVEHLRDSLRAERNRPNPDNQGEARRLKKELTTARNEIRTLMKQSGNKNPVHGQPLSNKANPVGNKKLSQDIVARKSYLASTVRDLNKAKDAYHGAFQKLEGAASRVEAQDDEEEESTQTGQIIEELKKSIKKLHADKIKTLTTLAASRGEQQYVLFEELWAQARDELGETKRLHSLLEARVAEIQKRDYSPWTIYRDHLYEVRDGLESRQNGIEAQIRRLARANTQGKARLVQELEHSNANVTKLTREKRAAESALRDLKAKGPGQKLAPRGLRNIKPKTSPVIAALRLHFKAFEEVLVCRRTNVPLKGETTRLNLCGHTTALLETENGVGFEVECCQHVNPSVWMRVKNFALESFIEKFAELKTFVGQELDLAKAEKIKSLKELIGALSETLDGPVSFERLKPGEAIALQCGHTFSSETAEKIKKCSLCRKGKTKTVINDKLSDVIKAFNLFCQEGALKPFLPEL